MKFVDTPAPMRCEATIRLRDGSGAQCGRRRAKGSTCCWQHDRQRGFAGQGVPGFKLKIGFMQGRGAS